ncbi:hypothetical protein [Haloprofundus halophilus]|uniref:hypothetical protein n=1 Tax=Haloprofundus halophilus TaxID=2283527 RepID=UPI000E42E4A3|nr:hypothetical protein [Haloprofundus halophilus]
MKRRRVLRGALILYGLSGIASGVTRMNEVTDVLTWATIAAGAVFIVVAVMYDGSMTEMERTPYFQLVVGGGLLYTASTAFGFV